MKLFNEKISNKVKEVEKEVDIDLEDISLESDLALEELNSLLQEDDLKETALENLNSIKECLIKSQSLDMVIGLFKSDFETMGIVSGMSVEDAVASIESIMDNIEKGEPSEEIIAETIIVGSYLITVIGLITASVLWETTKAKQLQSQMVKIDDISKRSDVSKEAALGLKQVKCPEYKELAKQFQFNDVIFKRTAADLSNTLKSVNKKAYKTEFAKIGITVDVDSGKIEGDGKLSLEKNFLVKRGYTIKNILELLRTGLKQLQTVKVDLNKTKAELTKLSKIKASTMSEEEASKLRADAKFVIRALKEGITTHKRDIRILKRVAWAVPGISHNVNVNVT